MIRAPQPNRNCFNAFAALEFKSASQDNCPMDSLTGAFGIQIPLNTNHSLDRFGGLCQAKLDQNWFQRISAILSTFVFMIFKFLLQLVSYWPYFQCASDLALENTNLQSGDLVDSYLSPSPQHGSFYQESKQPSLGNDRWWRSRSRGHLAVHRQI